MYSTRTYKLYEKKKLKKYRNRAEDLKWRTGVPSGRFQPAAWLFLRLIITGYIYYYV